MRHRNVYLGAVMALSFASATAACSYRAVAEEEEIAMSEPEPESSAPDATTASTSVIDFSTLTNKVEAIATNLEAGRSAPDWAEGDVVGVELLHNELSSGSREDVLTALNLSLIHI